MIIEVVRIISRDDVIERWATITDNNYVTDLTLLRVSNLDGCDDQYTLDIIPSNIIKLPYDRVNTAVYRFVTPGFYIFSGRKKLNHNKLVDIVFYYDNDGFYPLTERRANLSKIIKTLTLHDGKTVMLACPVCGSQTIRAVKNGYEFKCVKCGSTWTKNDLPEYKHSIDFE